MLSLLVPMETDLRSPKNRVKIAPCPVFLQSVSMGTGREENGGWVARLPANLHSHQMEMQTVLAHWSNGCRPPWTRQEWYFHSGMESQRKGTSHKWQLQTSRHPLSRWFTFSNSPTRSDTFQTCTSHVWLASGITPDLIKEYLRGWDQDYVVFNRPQRWFCCLAILGSQWLRPELPKV